MPSWNLERRGFANKSWKSILMHIFCCRLFCSFSSVFSSMMHLKVAVLIHSCPKFDCRALIFTTHVMQEWLSRIQKKNSKIDQNMSTYLEAFIKITALLNALSVSTQKYIQNTTIVWNITFYKSLMEAQFIATFIQLILLQLQHQIYNANNYKWVSNTVWFNHKAILHI